MHALLQLQLELGFFCEFIRAVAVLLLQLLHFRLELLHLGLHLHALDRLPPAQRIDAEPHQQRHQNDANAVIGDEVVQAPQDAVHQVRGPHQQAGPQRQPARRGRPGHVRERVQVQAVLVPINRLGSSRLEGPLEQANFHRAVVEHVAMHDGLPARRLSGCEMRRTVMLRRNCLSG